MTYPEKIITIDSFGESVSKEKGSTFIGQVYPVENQDAAEDRINSIRKKYYDATHHCYAFRILPEIQKFSDDGEPSGTAGLRIINAIEHFNLSNLLVVIIRYFGGIKLGIGPLGKAYYSSAFDVLEKTKKIEKYLFEKITVKIDFNYISQLHKIVSDYKGKIENTQYENDAVYQVIITPQLITLFKEQISNITKGSAAFIDTNERFYV
jgi:uncharacterized YigZ family protein